MDCRFLIPSYELAEGGRAEGISRVQGRHLFDEEDAIPRVTCIAMVRQRAEGRVVAEETEDQGVAFREGWVDRCAAVERGGMEHDHAPGLRRPRSNVVSVRVELALSLDVGKARQGAASMQGLGRIVRIAEGGSVVTSSAVRASNDFQCVLLGDGFEADPRIAPMNAGPRQIGDVLMPGRARTPSAGLGDPFRGEIPNMFGSRELGEQSAEGRGSPQFIRPGLGERVGFVVVRLLLVPMKYPKGVGAVGVDAPSEAPPT